MYLKMRYNGQQRPLIGVSLSHVRYSIQKEYRARGGKRINGNYSKRSRLIMKVEDYPRMETTM